MAVTMAILPLRKLVNFYMYLVSCSLLGLAHYLSFLYVEAERAASHTDYTFEQSTSIQRLGSHLLAQCVIGATVAYLLNVRSWAKVTLLIYTVPMFVRILHFPVEDLHRVHNFSAIFMLLQIVFYIFQKIPVVLDIIKTGVNKVTIAVQLYGWIPFLVAMWFKILLPVQFLSFWLALFALQVYKFFSVHNHPIFGEGWVVVVLASVGECCVSPISLIGLCVTVSYVAYLILALTKVYLTGRGGFLHDNVMHRGWTEGFTMLLLSIQTGIIELKAAQRAFLMIIILFIVCSSLIQSMYEITEPFLLELSASQNKSKSKHVRAIVLTTFLWIFPLFMTHKICLYFDLDFWLLVVISSCVLTSVQVLGSLSIYVLFIYDSIRDHPWESLDDVVYYAKASTRVLEFIVAVFVVAYGVKESVLGEWSWINSSILLIHCYFNVWQRLQAGWKSYLLRREAAKKIESLPIATPEQLAEHNDVCPICFQELVIARITNCNHFFHELCLRKWLYVQESCPLCHQKIHIADSDTEKETAQAEQPPGEPDDPGAGGDTGEGAAGGGEPAGGGQPPNASSAAEFSSMGSAAEPNTRNISARSHLKPSCTCHDCPDNHENGVGENYVFVETKCRVENQMCEDASERQSDQASITKSVHSTTTVGNDGTKL